MPSTTVLLPQELVGLNAKQALLNAGFVFHDPPAGNAHMQVTMLPAGWKFYSSREVLFDQFDRLRAKIYSDANIPCMDVFTRLTYGLSLSRTGPNRHAVTGVVFDSGTGSLIYKTATRQTAHADILQHYSLEHLDKLGILVGNAEQIAEIGRSLRQEAKDWLDRNFPDWQDTSLYW